MKQKIRALCVSAALSFGMAIGANASTFTYTNADATPKVQLSVDDTSSPGKLRLSLSTLTGTADYLALGFNFAGLSIAQSDISLISATRANDAAISPALVLFGNNTGSQSTCGQGCNFNGAGSPSMFYYILRIGENGSGQNNYVKSVVFDIMTSATLTDSLFSQIALRAQSTSNPSGSIKTDLNPAPSPVPLPAGLPLLGSGLLALGMWRRRRTS